MFDVEDKINRILGNKIIECPDCMGDGLDEDMRTCRRCVGSGSISVSK